MDRAPIQTPSAAEAPHEAGAALFVTRILFWLHLAWLFSLPGLAVVAAHLLLPETDVFYWLALPTFVYVSLVIQAYQLQVSLWSIVLVLLVPFQVAISTILFGASSLVFLIEICLIEIGALMVAAVLGTWRAHQSEAGAEGGLAAVVIMLTALLVVGPGIGLYPALVAGYESTSIWAVVLFISAFGTAAYRQSKAFLANVAKSGMDAKVGFSVGDGSKAIGPVENPALIGVIAMAWYAVAPWIILWVLAMFGIDGPS